MFTGHYTTAFLAKSASPRLPLWLLLLAAQFVDVLWVLFILTGVEQARLVQGLPSNPLDLFYMPWTHSLAATALWAAVAFAAARAAFGLAAKDALLVAGVVASHWFLDLVVHRDDLTIAGGEHKLGFALWNYPVAAWLLEVLLVAGSAALAMRACARDAEDRRQWYWLGGGLVVVQTATSFGPLPESLTAMVLSSLIAYLMIAHASTYLKAEKGSGTVN